MRRILPLLLVLASLIPILAGCADSGVERADAWTAVECLDQHIQPVACAYLSSALDTVHAHALVRDAVDWNDLRKAAFERASRAENIAETYPAIQEVLHSLGDNHSFFLSPDDVLNGETAAAHATPYGRILNRDPAGGNLARIVLPPLIGIDEASSEKYADSVQDSIWQLRHNDPCGWIVDIRGNTGGNMWPMLAGIGPLLGEGDAGAMIADADDLTWGYENGKAILGDSVLAEVPDPIEPAIPSETPVAVLTSRATASSGEAIAIAFRERPNTRSFGQPTAGVPTGNSIYVLADGAWLILTTVRMGDRTGRVYQGRIEPDFVIEASDALDAAAGWLASSAPCKNDGD